MPITCPECDSENVGQDPRNTEFFCHDCGAKWEENLLPGYTAKIKWSDEIVDIAEINNSKNVRIDRDGIIEMIGKDDLEFVNNGDSVE